VPLKELTSLYSNLNYKLNLVRLTATIKQNLRDRLFHDASADLLITTSLHSSGLRISNINSNFSGLFRR